MKLWTAMVSMALAASVPTSCWAWGATGHEWISGIAIERLPDSLPAFVGTPEAAAEIAVMGRELDRSKGAGKTHEACRLGLRQQALRALLLFLDVMLDHLGQHA